MRELTVDQLRNILDKYVREYRVADGIWCIGGDQPHLAQYVHVRADGFVSCWRHSREGESR